MGFASSTALAGDPGSGQDPSGAVVRKIALVEEADGVSVEKVLIKPASELSLPVGAPIPPSSRLPYDAILWVILKKP